MKKIRILQTPIRFYPHIGGVEYHAYYLSKLLVQLGYEVTVVCANEPRGEKNEILNGINIERLDYSFKIANTNISLGFPFVIWKANFDIAHTHVPTPWTADWTVWIAKLRKKPSVLTIHADIDKPDLFGKILTWIYLNTFFRLTLHLADRVIIVNPEWEATFKKTAHLFKRISYKITTMPNGVDIALFKPLEAKPSINSILFVAVLDAYHRFKGLGYLLDAMPKIKQAVPDAKLIIVGDGVLLDEYRMRTRELGIDDCVEFHGKRTQAELVQYYQNAKVFVLPSIEIEGFAIVPLEAMASGTPLVITDINGIAKQIKQYKTGEVVPSRDSNALAKAITFILKNSDYAKEMGANGRSLINQQYSWQMIAQNISAVYEQIYHHER